MRKLHFFYDGSEKMTIWKYPIDIITYKRQLLSLPKNSEVLTFQLQNDQPTIWVLVPDKADILEDRYFLLQGTGFEFDLNPKEELEYIGTVQLLHDKTVWHLFEVVVK